MYKIHKLAKYAFNWNIECKYPRSIRALMDHKRHYDVAGNRSYRSVTTILYGTESDEKRPGYF